MYLTFHVKGGEKMSLDAIKKVTETEQDSQARKTDALAEAKRITAEAARAGKERLELARSDADGQVKEFLRQAEEKAAARSGEIMTKSAADCGALRASAQTRLSEAAQLIVGRVVNG